ncbi:MAG: DUF424 family protein [Candidatus Nitrosoabyssus spongiisocia]|nr:MAG: DUF424 family protein [Nitrosopumilaceae archaeon AB1(1)]
MSFSVNIIERKDTILTNICDADLLDKNITTESLNLHISPKYYGGDVIGISEAETLLRKSTILNMVGQNIISLSLKLGIGSTGAVKKINNTQFLIVYKM